MDQIGKTAYEAYCQSVGGKSAISGDPLPGWEDQSFQIRTAWIAAGRAVLDAQGPRE